ncbi:unnamed protein product, partial [Mesorhabditis spiculigera]
MGNIESAADGSLSRRSSQRKSRSPSPSSQKRSNSLRRNQNGAIRAEQPLIRRSKTCRVKDRTQRIRPLCMITGLSSHQKTILAKRWNKMDNARLYEMGKKVFEGLFTENPSFLPFIGLSAGENWRKSIVFRLHAQRFVTAVCESLRRMRDTQAACDVLRDFGAHYSGHKIPNAYFEKMATALCGAIKEFEGQTTLIEPEQRHRSPSADPSSSSATDSSAISNGQKIEPKHGSSLSTISNNTTRGEISENKPAKSSGFSSRHSDSSMYRVNGSGALCSNSLRGTPPHNSSDSDSPPIRGPAPSFLPPFPNSLKNLNNINNNNCPITTEAWHIFATFVANQVKLGYELEKVLQYEMAKLGLSTQHTVSPGTPDPFNKHHIDVEFF